MDNTTAAYRKYNRRVGKLAKSLMSPSLHQRLDVDDIVQLTFADFFLYGKNTVEKEWWPLLHRITTNVVREEAGRHNAKRRDVRRSRGCDPNRLYDTHPTNTTQNILVRERLDSLSPIKKELVTLRLQGHSVEEMSAKTGKSMRTIERIFNQMRCDPTIRSWQ